MCGQEGVTSSAAVGFCTLGKSLGVSPGGTRGRGSPWGMAEQVGLSPCCSVTPGVSETKQNSRVVTSPCTIICYNFSITSLHSQRTCRFTDTVFVDLYTWSSLLTSSVLQRIFSKKVKKCSSPATSQNPFWFWSSSLSFIPSSSWRLNEQWHLPEVDQTRGKCFL